MTWGMISEKLKKRADALCRAMDGASGVNPLEKTRKRAVVTARAFVAYALVKEGFMLTDIGRALGFDHATIIHYKEMVGNILTSPGYDAEREMWEQFNKKIEEMDRKQLGEPFFGEKLSPVLSEIEDAILDHLTDFPGERPRYTMEGFNAAVNIFVDVILDKMWLFGDANGWTQEMRRAFATQCGNDIRGLVKRYTGIDTHKAVENVYAGAKEKDE